MASLHILSFLLLLAELVTSSPSSKHTRRQETTTTKRADGAVNTACGDIIDFVNQGFAYFQASDAFECLKSVSFNDAVALRFIDYYNTTLQFQSTLAYLKSPLEGYQQPAVDLLAGLQDIKDNVTAGAYQNQYIFEAEVMRLVYSAHDAHVDLYAGIMSTFLFASEWEIVSVSRDGTQLPEIYIAEDIVQHQNGYNVFPIKHINGVDAAELLERFAALNSVGMLEPHADWNQLMYSPVQNVIYDCTIYSGGAKFYEGDWLNYTFANGSTFDTSWYALYTYSAFTGPLTTGGDFYNYFVLGLDPASYDDVPLPEYWDETYSQDASTSANYTFDQGWYNITGGEYPPADIKQDDLEDTGYVTGYYLDDISTAVLSIPTFDETGWAVGNFSKAVERFFQGAQDRSLSKLIIDLQGNWGGTPLLAFTTFRSIFPGRNPFAGSRRRSHDLANVLGSTKTAHFLNDSANDSANEWVVVNRLNAKTNENFTSWAEYAGPQHENGDTFSLVERYDLANENFDWEAFDGWAPPAYLAGFEDKHSPVFDAENIVLLTDGTCSSTCVLFMEMMTHQAGARTIVVGGQPRTGPMQAASGSRGAAGYDSYLLDLDFSETTAYDANTKSRLPDRSNPGMQISYAGFNLRDQVRSADDPAGPPLQFTYLAADCRLWFTLDNVLNLTSLWHDVAIAAWTDSSRCVIDSTSYASPSANSTATSKTPSASNATSLPELPAVYYEENAMVSPGTIDTESIHDTKNGVREYQPVKQCYRGDGTQKHGCKRYSSCQTIKFRCDEYHVHQNLDACVQQCNYLEPCNSRYYCQYYDVAFQHKRYHDSELYPTGVCVPKVGTPDTLLLGCVLQDHSGDA